jgi:hypothetical protein
MTKLYTPLVVLYSTSYRTWNTEMVYNSQKNIIDKLSDFYSSKFECTQNIPIIGIHYWSREVGHKQLMEDFVDYESVLDHPICSKRAIPAGNPPEIILNYPNKLIKTEQFPLKEKEDSHFDYFIISTRLAFKLANELHLEMFGVDMPEDQPILKLRPDLIVEYNNLENLNSLDFEESYLVSNYCSAHRPHISENEPEVVDAIFLTRNSDLRRLLEIEISEYQSIYEYYRNNYQRTISFTDHYMYTLLEHSNIKIVVDNNLKFTILRSDGYLNVCTL